MAFTNEILRRFPIRASGPKCGQRWGIFADSTPQKIQGGLSQMDLRFQKLQSEILIRSMGIFSDVLNIFVLWEWFCWSCLPGLNFCWVLQQNFWRSCTDFNVIFLGLVLHFVVQESEGCGVFLCYVGFFLDDFPGWNFLTNITLVGGFNPFEKYESKWIISLGRGENKTHLKPPPR